MHDLTPRQIEIADSLLRDISRVADLDFSTPDAKSLAQAIVIDYGLRFARYGKLLRDEVNIGRQTVIELEVIEKLLRLPLCKQCKEAISREVV